MYAFFFSLCYENFEALSIPGLFTITKMLGVFFAVCCFLQIPGIFTNLHWTILSLLWMLLELAIVTAIAELSHPVPRTAFVGSLLSLAQCFLLYCLCIKVMRDRRTAAYALLAFTASAALMSVLMKLGIGRQALRESAVFERVSFLGTNSNMIAIWAAVGIIIIASLVTGNLLRWGSWRYGLLILVAPMLTVMTESGSRGAAVSLVLAMACFIFAAGSLNKRLLIGVATLGILCGLFYLSKDSVLASRLQITADTGNMAGREEIWPAALKMIEQKPLLGWGMWNSEDYNGNYSIYLGALEGDDPHNVFLAFFVFGGALVGLPLLCLSGWWLYQTFSERRGSWGILPFALAVFMLSTMFKAGGFYVTKVPWIILAFATAASMPYAQSKTRHLRQRNRRFTGNNLQLSEPPPEPVPSSHGPPGRRMINFLR